MSEVNESVNVDNMEMIADLSSIKRKRDRVEQEETAEAEPTKVKVEESNAMKN